MDDASPLRTSRRRRAPVLSGGALLALAACAPGSEPLVTSLDLPQVTHSLPLRIPAGAERACVEVLGDGKVSLGGEVFTFARMEDGRPRFEDGYRQARSAIVDALEELEEDEGFAPATSPSLRTPFLLLADRSVPWKEVQAVYEYGLVSGTQHGRDVLLAVNDPADPHPAAIRVSPPNGFGMECNFDMVPVKRYATWSPSRDPEVGEPVLSLSRLVGFRDEAAHYPEPPQPRHLVGDELVDWLNVPLDVEVDGELGMRGLEGATWGDVVELFDLCIENGYDWAGDVGLYPTIQRLEWVKAGGSL
jgi:hypothetical protein